MASESPFSAQNVDSCPLLRMNLGASGHHWAQLRGGFRGSLWWNAAAKHHSTSLSISESEKNLSGRHAKCRLLCSISKPR